MDQQKIGGFLRELRGERGLTQEQLAEMLGVSNRSVSRWENGRNMPDFDLVLQIAHYYDVSVEEILDGERRAESADSGSEKALQKVADYGNAEKLVYSGRVRMLLIIAAVAMFAGHLIDVLELSGFYLHLQEFLHGIVFGMTLAGLFYTTRFMAKCREFKMRLLKKKKPGFD